MAVAGTAQGAVVESWADGLKVLERLRNEGLEHIVTYGAAMAAVRCSWQSTLSLLRSLSVRQIRRSVIACNTMTSAATRCQQWEISMSLLGRELSLEN
eukprot:Skav230753  [mRNA]  locus=scaffold4515:23239:24878:+ [translate_table: standard]